MSKPLFPDDPDIDPLVLRAANAKHDAEYHTICMWQRARYRGGFGFPADEERTKRVRDARMLRKLPSL